MNRMQSHARPGGGAGPVRGQRGATLITAMVLLLILTLLGVTALNTTTLEERMAANTQEQMRAFQAAESGLSAAFASPTSFVADATTDEQTEAMGGGATGNAGANYRTSYTGQTAPPRGSGWEVSADKVALHFETVSTAYSSVTGAGGGTDATTDFAPAENAAIVILHGGAYQIGNK